MTDVFNSEAPVTPPVVDPVEKRLQDKDAFIEQLKRETAEMREEVKKAAAAQAQLDELRDELTRLKEQTIQPREPTNPALSESSIAALVERAVTANERNRAEGTNIQEANTTLIQHFAGDQSKAAAHVQAKAKELGVKVEFLRDMAAKSPTGFLKLMDATKVESPQGVTIKSEIRTESKDYNPTGGLKEGSKEWFDNLRRTDKTRYWSPEIQQQIFKAAKEGKYLAA